MITLSICSCEKDNQKNPLVGTWVKCHNVFGDPSYYDESGEPIVHLCDPSFLKERMKDDPDWDVIRFTKDGIMYNNTHPSLNNVPYQLQGDTMLVIYGEYYSPIKIFDKKACLFPAGEYLPNPGRC